MGECGVNLADEGGGDEVDTLLHAEDKVLLVLGGDGGKVDLGSRQIDALHTGTKVMHKSTGVATG